MPSQSKKRNHHRRSNMYVEVNLEDVYSDEVEKVREHKELLASMIETQVRLWFVAAGINDEATVAVLIQGHH